MAEAPAGAEPVAAKRRGGNRGTRDHESMEWAGTPHEGKTGRREAQLVRENLEAINERLIAQGCRPVDPANPEHARRYGFGRTTEVQD